MKTYQEALKEMLYWRNTYGEATNFHSMLFALIGKADARNKEAIRRGFPCEVQIFEEWQAALDERAWKLAAVKKLGVINGI